MYVRSFAYFFMIKHQLYSNSEVDMLLYTSENRYDNSTKEASFSVGLQGVQHNDVDAVKNIIWNTLEKVSRYVSVHVEYILLIRIMTYGQFHTYVPCYEKTNNTCESVYS